jgi:hypothetical protein
LLWKKKFYFKITKWKHWEIEKRILIFNKKEKEFEGYSIFEIYFCKKKIFLNLSEFKIIFWIKNFILRKKIDFKLKKKLMNF